MPKYNTAYSSGQLEICQLTGKEEYDSLWKPIYMRQYWWVQFNQTKIKHPSKPPLYMTLIWGRNIFSALCDPILLA